MFSRAALKVSGVGGLMSAAVFSTTRREEERERTRQVPPSSLAGVEAAVAGGEVVVGVAGVEARGREEIVAGPALLADGVKPQEQGRQAQAEKLKAAINKARNLVWCKMYESGAPGMVVAISVNGKLVWQHGFGYSDLENHLIAGTGCIMRIASISKPLTMAVLAKELTASKHGWALSNRQSCPVLVFVLDPLYNNNNKFSSASVVTACGCAAVGGGAGGAGQPSVAVHPRLGGPL